ncbi:MAG: flagellar biosynthesis protein FlgM [Alphaproteobacteria bacterium]|nr:flagellar biosynthesis protein FlgM [Alphaproteobacteria bacterium]
MVKWRGREGSGNVEDRRGGAPVDAGLAALILRLVASRFGIGGLAALAAVYVGLTLIGVRPLALLSGAGAGGARGDADTDQFVSVILRETEIVWGKLFEQAGMTYREPKLDLFAGGVQSGCGFASAAVGPFYCPADQHVYLDTDFFSELSRRFGAPGDFAAAYVIAHEVGHHVQKLTGVADRVAAAQARAGEAERNALQVRMELQADCYAGVWAHWAGETRGLLDDGDIEEGLNAASKIGDDTLQRNAGRRVTPESFTHGSSAQRVHWFKRGYQSGATADCDTFGAQSL